MKRKVSLLLAGVLSCLCVVSAITVVAQSPETIGAGEIFLRMKKLNVLGSVLYVAAHPDDENSRLIAYMAKDRLYRTGYLSMTRGDGGQNLIGDEQGIELGLIRTQEMLAARRVDGAEQFFTRAFDFGFTKSTDEALKTWNKDKILSDVVWVIRKFQPDILITRFPEDSRAGHGHHSASAVLAHEAFTAAADPSRFPEQFKYGVKPWQVRRLFWNTFNFGSFNTTSEDQMKVDVGGYNAIIGKSYGELAAESRTNHKSQGAALTPARGQSLEYFSFVAGDNVHGDPMEDIGTSWNRVKGGEKIGQLVDQLIQHYNLADPVASVPALVDLYKAIGQLPESYWTVVKKKEVQQLIEACSGLWLEATVKTGYIAQGDSLPISFVLNNRLNAHAEVNRIVVNGFDTAWQVNLTGNRNFSFTRSILVSDRQPITQPYWLAAEMTPGAYTVNDQLLIGDAQSAPAYAVKFYLTIEGEKFIFSRPVQYKYTDAVKGELYQPLTVLPPVTGQFDPALVFFTDGEDKRYDAIAQVRTSRPFQPKLSLTNSDGVASKLVSSTATELTFNAIPYRASRGTANTRLLSEAGGRKDSVQQLKTIAYDHIPRIDYFRPAIEKFVVADVRIAGKRIGYIEGAGDKVPPALQQMGYEVVILKEKDITPANLRQFDAILTGVRAYDVHDWLFAKYEVLMAYIKDGGNLIVQYNRNNLGNAKVKIGPYPFAITNTRVTDETAAVKLLKPDHAVLNFPNKITDEDFAGWIQERGIYFAGQTDPAYEPILGMNDPGEPEQKGSLIIAPYGKGSFTYTGLVFFRELPAGVPGAYRLLANIIALNKKKGF